MYDRFRSRMAARLTALLRRPSTNAARMSKSVGVTSRMCRSIQTGNIITSDAFSYTIFYVVLYYT